MSVDYTRYREIRAEREARILTLTFNRPAQYNAVNHELHEELSDIFYDVAKDEETDVVVLTGAGKAFCAGGDLRAMKEHADEHGGPGNYLSRVSAKRIIYSLLDLEQPIIAKVNGPCVGLGATIALFCDIIYMADDATIGDPHVKAGVVAGDGGAIIWPQLIGYARAKEYLMTGDAIQARDAERMGLVNHVVPRDGLDRKVQEMAQRLADGPRDAIRWSKVCANVGLQQLAHSILDASMAYEFLTLRSPTHKEAIQAFAEKRKPRFRGL
ncbi:enoyl-CoA hydratase/isomerase family protein [Bradyrhizobium sp. 195]|uniref:enoyl-CoA hydratase/isomerase family protein n=1 Tax=Bradyrhizobium sp. 195 TaxID=2782662 RepID=UPI002001B652|nr:enoyl-CoA hydratase-related protein [Bradyrhizobium sp. 195]UPK25425.1 enoyl-CoA hydratase/isomerase family protein [Bradyrhizobium sp. 195]